MGDNQVVDRQLSVDRIPFYTDAVILGWIRWHYYAGASTRKSHDEERRQKFLAHVTNTLGYIPCPKCSPGVNAFIRVLRREFKWMFPSRSLREKLVKGIPVG